VDAETVSGTTTTNYFMWCGSTICQKRNGSQTVTRRDLDEGEYTGSAKYIYMPDQLGSARDVLAAASGSLIQSYDFTPYGALARKNTTTAMDYQYAGMFNHPSSTLNLSATRPEDGVTGRWLGRDLMGEFGGVNLYAYVNADPIGLLDPLGLLDACPDNQRLTCRAHQNFPGDFGGQGYGTATKTGLLWDTPVIVKYGQYDCTTPNGSPCTFSGPGEIGSYNLFGVVHQTRYIPYSGTFRDVPQACWPFVIDPTKRDQYPPEIFKSIKDKVQDCRTAGTCNIINPPFDPQ
jgi:RHS repeat-associated protein